MKDVLNCMGHEIRYPDIVSAKNCTLRDSRGIEYLDLEAGIWCSSVGHANPRIAAVLAAQSKKIIHTGYSYLNPAVKETAKKLLRITGIGDGQCVFLSSGSEAVEFSVKAVRSISKKPFILTLKDSYLAAFGSAGAKSKEEWILLDWIKGDPARGIPFDKVSAFIFEPGSSSGLVRFPPAELIEEIVREVRAHGGIVVANEVTTGMGRTGEWFGYQHYGLVPDVVALGKGLGNGYPVSAVVVARAVSESLGAADFHYGQSHQNDPLGAAVAGEVIDIIKEEDLLKKCKADGKAIMDGLNAIREKHGIIKEVRGRGLMVAVEFEKAAGKSWAELVNAELLKRNIILVKRPGFEVFRMDPALTIDHRDIEYFLTSMRSIVAAAAR
jgi:acetylornithine/N-succinyldiaminopimelate aminotransferase